MGKYVLGFIKITSEEYANDFYNGNIYFNRLQYFMKCEKEEIRDSHETTIATTKSTISLKTSNNVFEYYFNWQDKESQYYPSYCMYSLYIQGKDFLRCNRVKLNDERLKKFGTHAVVIKYVKKFLNKIKLSEQDFNYSLVRYKEYINSTRKIMVTGNPVTCKDISFKHQQEFRIYNNSMALTRNPDYDGFAEQYYDTKYITNIESLKDIAEICTVDELFNGKEISFSMDWNFNKRKNLKLRSNKYR